MNKLKESYCSLLICGILQISQIWGGEKNTYHTINGNVLLEAEVYTSRSGTPENAWVLKTEQPGFMGSGYMAATAAALDNLFKPDLGGLDFSIDFKEAGTFSVHFRHYSKNHDDNSVHASIDGKSISPLDKIALSLDSPKQWHWFSAEGSGKEAIPMAPTFTITQAGIHTFTLHIRESGTRVDQIWISKGQQKSYLGEAAPEKQDSKDFLSTNVTNLKTQERLGFRKSFLLYSSVDLCGRHQYL